MSEEMTLNRQIGILVGEKIVDRKLITLSTDMLKSINVIEVSEQLSLKWKIMDKAWYDLTFKGTEKSKKIFIENLAWYKENIEKVYLPKEIKYYSHACYDNKEEFIEGIKIALWDCDMSHYRFSELIEGKYSDTILLKYEA